MVETIRAFIAVEIPNEETINAIMQYQMELQKSVGALKVVERALLHMTLRFLGNITLDDAKKLYLFIQDTLKPKHFASGPQIGEIKGVGDFRKQVFFVDVQGVDKLLVSLNHEIESKLYSFPQIQRENKPFLPHITIARIKDQDDYSRNRNTRDRDDEKYGVQNAYENLLKQYANFNFGPWRVEGVVLKKSVLTPKGPIYTNLTF